MASKSRIENLLNEEYQKLDHLKPILEQSVHAITFSSRGVTSLAGVLAVTPQLKER